MTILSVPGLFLALGLLAVTGKELNLKGRVDELERHNRDLEAQLKEATDQLREVAQIDGDPERVRQVLRERARNREMFRAIQEVQALIDRLASQGSLQFNKDQTLRFGDDLVSFGLNSDRADWKFGGPERLRAFCAALRAELVGRSSSLGQLSDLFAIDVEGHTDTTICASDPDCNWSFSSARAVAFLGLMRNQAYCPGGADLHLRPIGLADTQPEMASDTQGRVATRRISLRIVPNYQAIIAAVNRTTEAQRASSDARQ